MGAGLGRDLGLFGLGEKGGTAEELGFWGDGQVMATFFFALSLSLRLLHRKLVYFG